MFDTSEGYAYLLKSKSNIIEGDLQFRKHIYTFKSPKTNQTYVLEVDEFEAFVLCAVKFSLKAHRNSSRRFSLKSGLQEAPSILTTCINVLMQLYDENPYRSFSFIGMSSEEEQTDPTKGKNNTKRFRLYCKIVAYLVSDKKFHHYRYAKSSAYLLLNRDYAATQPKLLEQIESFFLKHYDLVV
jgi:hypothetical protein